MTNSRSGLNLTFTRVRIRRMTTGPLEFNLTRTRSAGPWGHSERSLRSRPVTPKRRSRSAESTKAQRPQHSESMTPRAGCDPASSRVLTVAVIQMDVIP